jgi:hypothetical protein
MADVTGPVSTLPGSFHRVPDSAVCDQHPEFVATHRVQGETNSFGAEFCDMCDDCYQEHLAARRAAREQESFCDYCKTSQVGCRPRRDYEEGMAGPVYNVCPSCCDRSNERLRQEMLAMQDEWDQDDYGDDDSSYFGATEDEREALDVEFDDELSVPVSLLVKPAVMRTWHRRGRGINYSP